MIKRAQLVQYDSAKGLSVKYACSQEGEGVENVGQYTFGPMQNFCGHGGGGQLFAIFVLTTPKVIKKGLTICEETYFISPVELAKKIECDILVLFISDLPLSF